LEEAGFGRPVAVGGNAGLLMEWINAGKGKIY